MWICVGLTLAACMSGVLAGFFFAFTNVVSPALAVIDPGLAEAALESVYGYVGRWPFQAAFFGTVGVACAALVAPFAAPFAAPTGRAWRILVVLASVAAIAGILGVTGARIAPAGRLLLETGAEAPERWRAFLAQWRFWNDWRTIGAAAAMILYLAALASAPPLWRRADRPREAREPRWRRVLAGLARLLAAPFAAAFSRLASLAPSRLAAAAWRGIATPVARWTKRRLGPVGDALMNRPAIVLGVAVALFAVMTGFFWAFAAVVMPALSTLAPAEALATLEAVNRQVRNVVFALLFFGGVSISRNVAGFALFATPGLTGILTLAAAAIYAGGVLALTIVAMVPINAAVASLAAAPGGPDPALAASLLADWAFWNDLRTLAGFAALATLACALVLATGRGRRGGRPAS